MIDTAIVTTTIISLLGIAILYVGFGDILDVIKKR